MKKPLKAVLFDFDGVLAKTMEDNYLAWKYSFETIGLNITKEDYMPFEGAPLSEIVKKISKKYNVQVTDINEMVVKKEKYFKENYSFSFYPGVLEFVEKLKSKNIKIAIVTAALKDRLFSTTPNDFLEKFDLVVTGNDYRKGKPNPDPYLIAAEKLDTLPENCVVIENAPLGIQSAKSAKICCVAICSTLNKSYLNEADIIVEKFEDLKEVDIFKIYYL
tara:strand:- start:2832 stop:3488 length:657 start_codon:yes stop_codon:yes gene_type:complete